MALTADMEPTNRPSFFLVGAAKCGTTTLAGWLEAHPDVFLSPVKEPHFFGSDIDPSLFSPAYLAQTPPLQEEYFQKRPLKKVHLAFVRDQEKYLQLFADALPHQVLGECSTGYFFSQRAPDEIAAFSPDAKIIIVLRDPVQRAFSHYLMALRYGYVSGTFADEWERDRRRQPKGWGISENFYELGLYAEALERFLAVFPKKNILVLSLDDLMHQPLKTAHRVFSHLGVSSLPSLPDVPQFAARPPRFPRLNRWLHASGAAQAARRFIPTAVVNALQLLLQTVKKPDLPTEIAQKIRGEYADDQARTHRILLSLPQK